MSRSLTTALLNALDDGVVYPFFAVDLVFSSGPLYVWTGVGNLVLNAQFTASISGKTMTVTAVASGKILIGAAISISGVTIATITAFVSGTGGTGTYTISVAQDVSSGAVASNKTYFGVGTLLNISSVEETTEIDAKGVSISMSGIPSSFLSLALTEAYQGRECRIYFGVVNSPIDYVEIFSGELDQMTVLEEAETCTISVTAESVLIKLERPVVRRFTDQDQKSRYPNDKGLEFIASLQNREIVWGRQGGPTVAQQGAPAAVMRKLSA